MKRYRQIVWLICLGILSTACGQEGGATPTRGATPTAVPASSLSSPTPLPPTETASPTNTATSTSTVQAVPTVPPTATEPPADTPTPEPADTAVPSQTEIIIMHPAADAEITVGQEITIDGRALPAPTQEMTVRLTLAGGLDVLLETAIADADGNWSVTAVLSATHTGPAELSIALPGAEVAVSQPITLLPLTGAEKSFITLSRPAAGDIAVAGYTFLFEGRVNNPAEDTITIAVLDANCTGTAANQSFMVTGGNWIGYTIVSSQAAPGPACAIAYTGVPGADSLREVRLPFTILAADDEEAIVLQLGNTGELLLQAGDSTYLFGIAINAPENGVSIRLEADDPARPSGLITSATAFANQYGFWEIDLEIPADAKGDALLYISIGSDDHNYREIRLPVTIQE